MGDCLFCAVENDEFEQIVFVEENLRKLAKKLGVSYSRVWSGRSRGELVRGYKIIRVDFEEVD